MLTISGKPYRLCDQVSRRSFLRIGGLALGGLSLPQILRAEAQSGVTGSHKSVIMIFLSGGPPHQDMVDLKPDAPVEIRGEFKPIHTNVPGIDICEHLPRIAAMTDRLAILRSVVGSEGQHQAFQCMTGRPKARQPQGGWPSFGSTVSKLQGPVDQTVPPFVGLAPHMKSTVGMGRSRPAGLPGAVVRAVPALRRRLGRYDAARRRPGTIERPQKSPYRLRRPAPRGGCVGPVGRGGPVPRARR